MARSKEKGTLFKKLLLKKYIFLGIILGISIFSLFFFINKQQIQNKQIQKKETLSSPPLVKDLYAKKDIFSAIQFKTRQIPIDQKIPNGEVIENINADFYFSSKSREELQKLSDDELIAMKCMPEQIYLNRLNKNYTILLQNGDYQEISLSDPNVLNIISKLQQRMPARYTLSQFIACQTNDNRFIVKYNAIQQNDATDGYNATTNPVAFFAQIFPNGNIQDVAYIELAKGTFCRNPIQLTKTNIFYYDCAVYQSDRRTTPAQGNYLYRIDLNKLNYTLMSHCLFSDLKATCDN